MTALELASKRTQLANIIKEKVINLEYRHDPFNIATAKTDWLFDFRAIVLNPSYLEIITELLYEKIKDRDNYQIGGLESAAIPLVTSLVQRAFRDGKSVNGFYIRKSRKKSGLYKEIEGELNDNPIIVVDDLINTAGSKMRVVEVLEALNKKVELVLVIIRYRDQSTYTYLKEKNITIASVFTLKDFDLKLGTQHKALDNPYRKTLLFDPGVASHMHVTQKSTPALTHDGFVYFGTDKGYFYAIDTESGEEKWKIKMGLHTQGKSIFSSPKLHNDLVYFGSYDGRIYCVDRHYGEVKWIFSDCDWIGSSPDIAPELQLIFIGLEHGLDSRHGSITALDIYTGEKKWEVFSAALTHASPLFVTENSTVYCGGNDGILNSINANTGEVNWKFQTEGGSAYNGHSGYSSGDIKLAPVYDKSNDIIAFTAMDGWMYVLNATSGTLQFRVHTDYYDTNVRCGIFARPLFTLKYVLFAGLDKTVYCHNKNDGSLVWRFATKGRVFASPVEVGSSIFIGSNDGKLYELETDTGTLLTRTQFTERITNPVVPEPQSNSLFVTTNANQLYKLSIQKPNGSAT